MKHLTTNAKTFNEADIIADLKSSGKHEAAELVQWLTAELETMMENLQELRKAFRSGVITQ
jgi:hypothetical protein